MLSGLSVFICEMILCEIEKKRVNSSTCVFKWTDFMVISSRSPFLPAPSYFEIQSLRHESTQRTMCVTCWCYCSTWKGSIAFLCLKVLWWFYTHTHAHTHTQKHTHLPPLEPQHAGPRGNVYLFVVTDLLAPQSELYFPPRSRLWTNGTIHKSNNKESHKIK